MEIKVKLTTPKGEATKLKDNFMFQKLLFGFNKPTEVYVNEEDTNVYWVFNLHYRKAMSIMKNIGAFKGICQTLMQSKNLNRAMGLKYSKEEIALVKEMLLDKTEFEILKVADLNEMKTTWDKFKEKLKKIA